MITSRDSNIDKSIDSIITDEIVSTNVGLEKLQKKMILRVIAKSA
jgi:hypothetical protein